MAEFSHPVRIEDIAAQGLHLRLEVPLASREAAARRLGLLSLPALSAELDLVTLSHGGLALTGMLSAAVEQRCVVTLEPVVNNIERPLNLRFLPPEAFREHEAAAGDPADAPWEGPDVEPLTGESLDLGELLLQELSLALDPYPRKPGAAFAEIGSADGEPEAAKVRPFADLQKLMSKAP